MKKKLTWDALTKKVVGHLKTVPPSKDPAVQGWRLIQETLRALARATNYENDPDCDLMNAFHDLDPEKRVR